MHSTGVLLLAIFAAVSSLTALAADSSDPYADLPDNYALPAASDPTPDSARTSQPSAPSDLGYRQSDAPVPPVAVGEGLLAPGLIHAGVTRIFTDDYDAIVVFGACVRVKVVIDGLEQVDLRGPVAQQLNNVLTWVANGVLYVTATGVTPAQLAAMDITVHVHSKASVVSVTAQSTGIVTLVDATNVIARQYQLFTYVYSSGTIIQVKAVVLQLNTNLYSSARMFITGRCFKHTIHAHVAYIDALGLYTRYTELALLWDSCFAYIRALFVKCGMVGGSSHVVYAGNPILIGCAPFDASKIFTAI